MENKYSIDNEEQHFRQFFEDCFHRYFEGMHRYAYTILKNNEDADDVVQLVFAKWWEKRQELKVNHQIKNYLYRAVHNRSLNYIRDTRNRKTDSTDFSSSHINPASPHPEDTVGSKEMINRLNAALEDLPPQCKLIFCKSRFQEKKYAEIAKELNLSIKTVEAQMGKALRMLRKKVYGDDISILIIISFLLNNIL